MLTPISKDSQDFDVIAFEKERYEVFQKTETQLPNPPKHWDELDGDWDARISVATPTREQWLSESYRRGYLEAIANQLDERYGLV